MTFVAAICLLGCSKSGKAGLVPATAADIKSSPDFKLEFTTKNGVKCYVRDLAPEVAQLIPRESRDQDFLNNIGTNTYFLMVPIDNDDQIVDGREVLLNVADASEISSFILGKTMK
jgi:hypothetical protein